MRDMYSGVYEGLQQGPENAETQAQYRPGKKEVEFEHLGDTCSPSANDRRAVPDKVLMHVLLY